MNIEQAVRVGEQLERAFDDVYIQGAKEPIFVIGRGHKRLERTISTNCKHHRVRRSHNVFAGLRIADSGGNKVMCEADNQHPGRRFKEVTECADCEIVLGFEEESSAG